jgi:predicted NAD/FAD-binding protein
MKRIAIIGSGISGLGAAYALKDTADVTVFEKRERAGGHACTHVFDYDGHETSVDLGFIVYNALNYPNLIGFFDALGVETQASDMSFGVSDPDGWEWASTLRGMFAQRGNLLSPRFHRFWRDILRFNDIARSELERGLIKDATLGAWLDRHAFSAAFRHNYVLPMGAAIWSSPEACMLDYPAMSFFQFFENHRLMHKERPQWRTVTGGSQAYVAKAAAALGPRLRTGTGVTRLFPFGDHTSVVTDDGKSHVFDDVILATHSDQTLRMIENSYDDQAFLLRSVHYRPNTIYLHRDPALMPARRNAWASWNVLKQPGDDICLTYWMNRLQGFDEDGDQLLVTLNSPTPFDEADVVARMDYAHPVFTREAVAAAARLRTAGGDRLAFAGAHLGWGFHEDGCRSGVEAAQRLGATW